MDNAIKAHIFGRRRSGDREEARILLFNTDDTPFVPGLPGPAGPAGPVGPKGDPGVAEVTVPISGLWVPGWAFMGGSGGNVTSGYPPITRVKINAPTSNVGLVQGPGIAGAKAKVVAYADTPTGPGAKVLESAETDHSTSGLKSSPFALPVGFIWISIWATTAVGLQNLGAAGNHNPYMPGYTSPATTVYNAWNGNNCGFVVRDPFPPTMLKGQAQMPQFFFQTA